LSPVGSKFSAEVGVLILHNAYDIATLVIVRRVDLQVTAGSTPGLVLATFMKETRNCKGSKSASTVHLHEIWWGESGARWHLPSVSYQSELYWSHNMEKE